MGRYHDVYSKWSRQAHIHSSHTMGLPQSHYIVDYLSSDVMRKIGYHLVGAFSYGMVLLSISNFCFLLFVADLMSYDIYLHWNLFFHFIIPFAFVNDSIRAQFWWRVRQLAIVAWRHDAFERQSYCAIQIIASNDRILSGMCYQLSYERQTGTVSFVCMRKHFLIAALHIANGYFFYQFGK